MARTTVHTDKGPQNFTSQVLTPVAGALAAPNPSNGHVLDVTLAANTTIAKPVYDSIDAGPFAGEELTFILRQSGLGSFTATWATGYKAVGLALTASTTGVDVVTFVYDGTTWNASGKFIGGTA
jgi:hypothetical protein